MCTGLSCYLTVKINDYTSIMGSNNISWNGNTVSWYNNANVANGYNYTFCREFQLNKSGTTYGYVATG